MFWGWCKSVQGEAAHDNAASSSGRQAIQLKDAAIGTRLINYNFMMYIPNTCQASCLPMVESRCPCTLRCMLHFADSARLTAQVRYYLPFKACEADTKQEVHHITCSTEYALQSRCHSTCNAKYATPPETFDEGLSHQPRLLRLVLRAQPSSTDGCWGSPGQNSVPWSRGDVSTRAVQLRRYQQYAGGAAGMYELAAAHATGLLVSVPIHQRRCVPR